MSETTANAPPQAARSDADGLIARLDAAAAGEPVVWAGVDSGVVERARNRRLFVGGAAAAGLFVVVLLIASMSGAGAAPLMLSMIGVIVAARSAYEGRRRSENQERVLWAATNRRLLRVTARGSASLSKSEIARVERRDFGREKQPSLVIAPTAGTAKRMGRVLTIVGPKDLDAAKAAFDAFED